MFGIVEQAGGSDRRRRPARGLGTTFRIICPGATAPPNSLEVTPLPAAIPDRPLRRGASVLLVEDEEAVRKLARITLEGSGYAVTDAPDGETALGSCLHRIAASMCW